MTNFTDIRDFLRAHCARYPELALQDVFKALYQSAFGCEHLIADPSAAADYIRAEAARSGDRISELVELLGGDYCRVHLGILQDGLSAETFARLFALSARHEECGREKLEAMLTALQTMADAGELPFSAQETAEAVERWRKDGFLPLHHSEIFRQNYAPAYRVLRRDFARALPLFARIDRLAAERSRVLVAIEGGSASGKTTLGELLQNVYGCPVFHMDDFFLRPEQRTEERFSEPGGNVDRVVNALIASQRAGIALDFEKACAIDLAGRDVLTAVQMSVSPKVIETPVIAAIAKDGIELRAKAKVTVRVNIDRLVGGAGEETIIARVGEGIVTTIGSSVSHKDVLENPDSISQTVLNKGLDSGTAFEILSIDIADVDVGVNVGAKLQIDQAEADKRIAQAKAEERRAMAVAQEQENKAEVAGMRARVIEAEAQVPLAMAEAFRSGNLGIMDYYKMKNLAADTEMRESIGKTTAGSADVK